MKKYQQIITILIFTVWPIIYLYSNNVTQVNFSEIIVPLFYSVIISALVYFGLLLILKNSGKATLITILFLIIFFSFGHIFIKIPDWQIFGLSLNSIRVIAPIVLVIFVTLFLLIWRKNLPYNSFIKILSVIGAVLIIMPLFNIGKYFFIESNQSKNLQEEFNQPLVVNDQLDSAKDIYYIILDGYARSDTLRDVYDFDNHEFTDYLHQEGFYIANDSHSNYAITFLSLASSLNGSFLEDQLVSTVNETENLNPIYKLIRESSVMRSLQSAGYEYITFGSGWGPTNHNKFADYEIRCGIGSEFLSVLIKTTILLPFQQYLIGDDSRHRILCGFDELAEIPKKGNPTFTFAHFILPHGPYLFDETGQPVTKDILELSGYEVWNNREGYLDQLIFTNNKIKELINSLISKSSNPPIIILQADHGSAYGLSQNNQLGWQQPTDEMLEERFGILNAYYLPSKENSELYSQITPVNSFRLIFNTYFGTNYSLLEDRNYYSNYDSIYQLMEVTDRLNNN